MTGVNGTTTFTVNSTLGWSIESVLPKPPTPVSDWLTATKIDGSTISVSYEANSGTSSRTVNIKAVGSGGLEKTVTVKQAPGTDAVFSVSPDSRSVTDASGTTTFTVSSLVGWTFWEGADWLKATKIDESTISVSYEANASTNSRTANIEVTALGGAFDSSFGKATEGTHVLGETVTVTQAAASTQAIWVSGTSVELTSKDETSQLTAMAFNSNATKQDVTASATWETSNSDVASVSSGGLVTAGVLPGTTKIKATFQGKSNSVLITVTQAAVFDVSPKSKSVGFLSGTTTFTVSSQVGWSVVDDAAWLTATKTDGSTISVSYTMNLSQSSRTANIKASGTGGLEVTVTVTQNCLILVPPFVCGS